MAYFWDRDLFIKVTFPLRNLHSQTCSSFTCCLIQTGTCIYILARQRESVRRCCCFFNWLLVPDAQIPEATGEHQHPCQAVHSNTEKQKKSRKEGFLGCRPAFLSNDQNANSVNYNLSLSINKKIKVYYILYFIATLVYLLDLHTAC